MLWEIVCGYRRLFGVSAEIPDVTGGFQNGPGVKIYIWEVQFQSSEWFRGLSVLYWDHRKVSGGPLGGATVGVSGTGVPSLAYLRPAAWLHQWPSTPRLHQRTLKTLARGQGSRGGRHEASSGAASPDRPVREAERSRQGVPREVPVTQAMTTKARRAPARVVSSFPLWC